MREESHLKTEVTKGEGHQVTLKVESGPDDLEDILEETYKDLAKQVKIPGFRKGKVPRAVIDSHLGADYVRGEAIKNGLPTLYVRGVVDAGIIPVSDPDINILDIGEDGSVSFEAKVDVKPEVEMKDYIGLEVEKPDTEPTDEDVKSALDEARDRFATLEVVESRPVEQGDFVMFDYKVFTDGMPLEGSSGSDRMTEIGSGDFLPDFDTQLVGARKGDILDVVINFPPDYGEPLLAGKPATFRTIVKEVKHKVLPDLDDDLAREISSFETLDEFKEDLRERIRRVKQMMGERAVKDQVVKALADKTYIDLPESMVQGQIDHEIEEMAAELEERGVTLDQYLEAMKGTRYQLEKGIRDKVVEGLKAELVMEAVASAEDIKVSDEEVVQYIRENSVQMGADSEKLIEQVRDGGRFPAIKANLRLNKAVDFLVENAVYAGGEPVKASEESVLGSEDEVEIETEPAVDEEKAEVVEAEEVGAELEEGSEEGPEGQ